MTAIKAAGHDVVQRGAREQVACQLVDEETIVRQVPVEGLDDTVAVRPHLAIVVQVQAVRVAVASRVEPETRHVLAIARREQEPIYYLFIRIRRQVSEESIDFRGGRGQAGEIERCPAQQRRLVRFGGWLEAGGLQAGQDEVVDGIARPLNVHHFG